jgi:hypothetical protein
MGTILVDVNAFNVLAIDVTAEVGAFVYDEAGFASLTGFVGEGGAEEAGAYYQIIVFLIHMKYKALKRVQELQAAFKVQKHTENTGFISHGKHRKHRNA